MVTYMEPQTAIAICPLSARRRTLRIPNFTHAPHAQPSPSNIPKWDSNFGEPSHSHVTTQLGQNPPKSKYQTYTLFDIHVNSNNIFPTDKMNIVLTLVGLPQRSQLRAVGGILQAPTRTASKTSWKLFVQTFSTQLYPNKMTNTVIPTYLNC